YGEIPPAKAAKARKRARIPDEALLAGLAIRSDEKAMFAFTEHGIYSYRKGSFFTSKRKFAPYSRIDANALSDNKTRRSILKQLGISFREKEAALAIRLINSTLNRPS